MLKMAMAIAILSLAAVAASAAESLSPEAKAAFDNGFEAMKKGDYLAAQKEYEKGLSLAPQSWEIRSEYVICLRKQNRLPASAKAGWQVIELAPEAAGLWGNLGNTFVVAHAWDEANTCFLKAAQFSKDKAWAAINFLALGYQLWANGQLAKAANAFQHGAAVDPFNGLALVDQGAVLFASDPTKVKDAKALILAGAAILKVTNQTKMAPYVDAINKGVDTGKPFSPRWEPQVSWQHIPAALLEKPKAGAAAFTVAADVERHYPLPEGDSLSLTTPEKWSEALGSSVPGHFFTIQFRPADGTDYQVLWSARYTKESTRDLKTETEAKLAEALPQAVEKKVALVPISAPRSQGYAFVITDKDFKPGAKADNYPYLVSITLQTGTVRSSITVLSHTKDAKYIQQMLETWKTLRHQAKGE
ncbi:MAG: tetratricopeptide repeat protein [Planctomycetota bacterium]|nr:tetratricopeptide repeat protein [Planctomycetota bacterium]